MTTVTLTPGSTDPWVCPAGVTSVEVQATAEGGNGAAGVTGSDSGASGGGGEFAQELAVAVTPGNSYSWTIGTGGTSASTVFPGDSLTVTAHHGGNASGTTAGAAGTGSTNTTHYSGGAGAAGTATYGGAGGGGGAGTTAAGGAGAAGGNSAGGTAGGGGAGGGGGGGNGGFSTSGASAGGAGTAPGGGGGGGNATASTHGAGGAGAPGQIVLTYTAAVTPALADAAGAADQVAAQITAIPPAVITAPRRSPGPPPPPVRAQVFTVPQGAAMPADTAAAAEAMTAGTVTVPLADAGGAADFTSGGIMPQDQAGATEAMAVTAVTAALSDTSGAATDLAGNVAAVQLVTSDFAAAADASQTTGLTQSDAGGAADKIAATVTVAFADQGAAADAVGQEPAIGASGGATRPAAMPGTSQVAVAPPGSQQWVWLGSIGQVTALTYSFTCPGGCDSMTCTVMVPASYRNQAFSPGWQVRVWRGGHVVWDGKMDEPVPTASGWNFTAVGTGMRGADFLAIYTDTWPAGQPDESINGAISRGLPWVNPGVGTPSWAWFGQAVDSGASTITALLNLICTRGGATWYVNSQPGGYPGDDLSVFPLPTVPTRLLISTTPVPRTLGGDINTIYLRYEISADTTTTSGDGSSVSVPAVYGLAVAQNAQSVAMHQELETFVDLSDAGVMTAAQAEEVGNYILAVYQRASFAGPFVGNYGALCNMGGVPIDPGTDQAGTVVRLILTDFSPGAELVSGPTDVIVGSYSWDDFAQTFTITPYQSLDQSVTGMLSMESVLLTPIQVAST